ncbi:MAG: Beta-glucuronidase [Verrucomicrobiota bacterium]
MKTPTPILAALAFCFTMHAQAQSTNPPVTASSFNWQSQRGGELKYLLYLPPETAAKPGERQPLMLFLHGAGERGTDVQRVAIHGPMSLVKRGTNFPFIIVAPQCPENQRWDADALMQLLAHVTAQHAVDTNRIYVTGLSMGGFGTWSLGVKYPEKFAAIAPICGGGNLIDMVLAGPEHEAALRALPIWAFHGAKDPVVPLVESERMVSFLKTRVGHQNVKLTVYPEAEHNSWTETYNNPKFYEWLLAQRRGGR